MYICYSMYICIYRFYVWYKITKEETFFGGVSRPQLVLDGGSGWGMVADQEPDWIRIRSLLTIFDKQFYNSVKIGPNFFL
jgi:hypothetical protein